MLSASIRYPGVDAHATNVGRASRPSDCRKRLGKLAKLQREAEAPPFQVFRAPHSGKTIGALIEIWRGVRSLGAVLVDASFISPQQGMHPMLGLYLTCALRFNIIAL